MGSPLCLAEEPRPSWVLGLGPVARPLLGLELSEGRRWDLSLRGCGS